MPTVSKERDDLFIKAWERTGGQPSQVARLLNVSDRAVFQRRSNIEARYNIKLPSALQADGKGRGDAGPANDYLSRVAIDGFSGVCIVSSDHHYWPGQEPSVAHQALVEVIKELKPKLNIVNGDAFDGAKLSRFPRNGWEYQPRVSDELEEAKERLADLRHAYRGARLLRTVGNHCIRFDRWLATNAGDFESIKGFRLADHLPEWQECMSIFVNGHTVIKHRFNGGIHSAYRNTLAAGTSIVTGHTHLLEVKPWGDYRGRRYGVSTGAIADVDGPQFSYTENNPTPWCSGFAVLTFAKDGSLLPPELCEVINGVALFRGRRIAGKAR